MSTPDPIFAVASRHNLTPGAVRALAEALARSGGRMAQWNHADLGGMGQWSGGGMIQIGDMFNSELKARVAAALEDLSRATPLPTPGQGDADADAPSASTDWWPGDLGHPSSSGAQNDMRYACFPEKRRLAVRRDGKVTVYDTGDRRLTGFAQAQGGGQDLEFTGPDGGLTLADLKVVN